MSETKTTDATQENKVAKKPSKKEEGTNLIKLDNFTALASIEKTLKKDQLAFIKKTCAQGVKTVEHMYTLIYRAHVVGADLLRGEMVGYTDNKGNLVTIATKDFMLRKAYQTNQVDHLTQEAIYVDEAGNRCDFWANGAKLVGATASVKRKDTQAPITATVRLSEYNKGMALWKDIPETMIKKVALTHALRLAFPNELGGVYDESEFNGSVVVGETVENPGAEPAKMEQVKAIEDMIAKGKTDLKEVPEDLTVDQAVEILTGGKR